MNSMGSLWIIFYYINIAWELWALVLCYFGVSWVMLKAFMALFPSWKGNVGKFNNGEIWMVVPLEFNVVSLEGKDLMYF